jgi:hypothetical protein
MAISQARQIAEYKDYAEYDKKDKSKQGDLTWRKLYMAGLMGTSFRFLSIMRRGAAVRVGNRDSAIVVTLRQTVVAMELVAFLPVFAQLFFSLSHAG